MRVEHYSSHESRKHYNDFCADNDFRHFTERTDGEMLGCYAKSPLIWILLRQMARGSLGIRLALCLTKLERIPVRVLIVMRRSSCAF